jgi:hypothetical protein
MPTHISLSMSRVRLVPFRFSVRDWSPFNGRACRGFRSAMRPSPAQPGLARPGPARAPLAPLPTPCAPPPPDPFASFDFSRAATSLSLYRGALGFGDSDRRSWIPEVTSPPFSSLSLSLPFSSLHTPRLLSPARAPVAPARLAPAAPAWLAPARPGGGPPLPLPGVAAFGPDSATPPLLPSPAAARLPLLPFPTAARPRPPLLPPRGGAARPRPCSLPRRRGPARPCPNLHGGAASPAPCLAPARGPAPGVRSPAPAQRPRPRHGVPSPGTASRPGARSRPPAAVPASPPARGPLPPARGLGPLCAASRPPARLAWPRRGLTLPRLPQRVPVCAAPRTR